MPLGDWLHDQDANKFNNSYFRDANNTGFAVDMSGDLVVRGRVGIGTSNPPTLLSLGYNLAADGSYNTGTRDLLQFQSYRHNGGFAIRNNDDNTYAKLEYIYSNWNNNIPTYGTSDGQQEVNTSVMTLRHDGYVGIGTTSPGQKLDVRGNIATTSALILGANYIGNGNGDGASTTIGNVTFNSWWGIRFLTYNGTCQSYIDTRTGTWHGNTGSTSDDRCKMEEVYIQDALTTILKLKPQKYKKYFNLDCSGHYQQESGLIAQDVYYDTPELQHLVFIPQDADLSSNPISTSSDPQVDPNYNDWGSTPASLNYIGLIPYLIKGIKEQQEIIEAEKAKTATLESQLADVLTRLTALENA